MFYLNISESIDRFGWINNEIDINECITKCYKQYLWMRCITVVALTTYDYHEELSRLLSSPPDQSLTTCLLESGFIH